mmetsp:Transcript_13640/g.31493  ORF Transcript_13640/g.31493 Transcript_13640/m.31493 type:complete len:225 (-) Transcript_13640:514-1188(-)
MSHTRPHHSHTHTTRAHAVGHHNAAHLPTRERQHLQQCRHPHVGRHAPSQRAPSPSRRLASHRRVRRPPSRLPTAPANPPLAATALGAASHVRPHHSHARGPRRTNIRHRHAARPRPVVAHRRAQRPNRTDQGNQQRRPQTTNPPSNLAHHTRLRHPHSPFAPRPVHPSLPAPLLLPQARPHHSHPRSSRRRNVAPRSRPSQVHIRIRAKGSRHCSHLMPRGHR